MSCGSSTKLFLVALLLFKSLTSSRQQFLSPCPGVFEYERERGSDRWYGSVTLSSDANLAGVWLRVVLDGPSQQLGNWFGDVSKERNEYLIVNRNFTLKAGVKRGVRFYVVYDSSGFPPMVASIRLNAKTICPRNERMTTTIAPLMGKLLTSRIQHTTTPMATFFTSIGSRFNVEEAKAFGEEDFFHGDLSALEQPRFLVDENDICGTVVTQPTPLITHGQSTKEGEFPWHAALYHAKGIDLAYICGASLISKNFVITVAHCVTKRKSKVSLNAEHLVIYLGKYYLKRWSNSAIQHRYSESITIHSDYNPQTYSNDIALVKLTVPAEITDYVRPVCLWDDDVELNTIVNRLGTVVGWGFDETGHVTEELNQAKMPVVSQETCIYSFPDFFARFTSSKTYCAGYRNGTSVCNGDSGGGMVFLKTPTNTNRAVWQLRGLVSISVALQNKFKCDSSHYVVFTDIAKYLDWIKRILSLETNL